MSHDNIIKFERRKPKREPRTVSPMPRKALTWISVVAGAGPGLGILSVHRTAEPSMKAGVVAIRIHINNPGWARAWA